VTVQAIFVYLAVVAILVNPGYATFGQAVSFGKKSPSTVTSSSTELMVPEMPKRISCKMCVRGHRFGNIVACALPMFVDGIISLIKVL
jgi:hypothetical protein